MSIEKYASLLFSYTESNEATEITLGKERPKENCYLHTQE